VGHHGAVFRVFCSYGRRRRRGGGGRASAFLFCCDRVLWDWTSAM
jgi:hypothetical protein